MAAPVRAHHLLHERLPDLEVLFDLEPEALAQTLLEILHVLESEDGNQMSRGTFVSDDLAQLYRGGGEQFKQLQRHISEAWFWLEFEGLIALQPDGRNVFITRRGKAISSQEDWQRFAASRVLPRNQLHPKIQPKAWPPYLRGAYDTAVFEAFKAVEVAVRAAGSFAPTDVGRDLMSKAFKVADPKKTGDRDGPLVDATLPRPEQEGMLLFFMGAFALYRNATGHRYVNFADPAEAAEVILMANHMMRIVERIAVAKGLPC